jgi:hypothetical protein
MIYPELSDRLYHGSTVKVDNIDLSKSAAGKDFGRGFYTTASRDQAVKFAAIKANRINSRNGFVSVFQYVHNHEIEITINNPVASSVVCCFGKVLDSGFNTQDYAPRSGVLNPSLTIKKFERADTEWLSFVLENRGFSNRQKSVLEKSFDIVIGSVANDAVGLVLNQLLIGTYGDPLSPDARDIAIRLLDSTRLYNQVFLGQNRQYPA